MKRSYWSLSTMTYVAWLLIEGFLEEVQAVQQSRRRHH